MNPVHKSNMYANCSPHVCYICLRMIVIKDTWSSPEVLQVDKYLIFHEYLIDKLYIRSKLILSTLKLPQLPQMNLLVMMTSQRHHIKTCDGNQGVWKKKICSFTFLLAWNSETVPWKSTRNWNLCMEHLFVHMAPFAGGSDVFKATRKTSEMPGLTYLNSGWIDNWFLRPSQPRRSHQSNFNSGNNCNLLPFKRYNSPNYPWRTWYEKCMCKVGTPFPDNKKRPQK